MCSFPRVPRHHRFVSLSDTLITNQSSGTGVLIRGLIGTCAQMYLITRIITIDWSGARLYVPNVVHTALLQGNWLEGHVHASTVTVLSSEMELQ